MVIFGGLIMLIGGGIAAVFGFVQEPTDWLYAGGGLAIAVIGLIVLAAKLGLFNLLGEIVGGVIDGIG